MQHATISIDLDKEEGKEMLLKYMKAERAFNALYEIRQYAMNESYSNRNINGREVYSHILDLLTKNGIDLDVDMFPPESALVEELVKKL